MCILMILFIMVTDNKEGGSFEEYYFISADGFAEVFEVFFEGSDIGEEEIDYL